MRACVLLLVLLGACGDDTTAGARGQCGAGGAINSCPPPDPTPEGACTYLVECGVISEASPNNFDWGNCVNKLEMLTATREELVIQCIVASTCDALQVTDSPDPGDASEITCFNIGDGK